MSFKGVVAVAGVGLLAGLALTGCTPDWASQNSGSYIMEVVNIAPAGGNPGDTIYSDVADDAGAVAVDNADVVLNIVRKNPSVVSTSALEHVYLDSYEVRYFRTDGRNVEGIDVPYRTMGAVGNVRLHTPTGEGEVAFTIPIVREQAKLEPPLRNLRHGGSAIVLTCIAEITIYGHQLNGGQGLKASGRTQVTFGDYPG
jgi:hypothetical protein